MTNYTVRIELHKANDNHYEELHSEMESRGFVRWISNGKSKDRLPTAEYNLVDSALDRAAVLEKAKAAANAVKANPTPWILVTQSAGRTWSGMKEWDEDDG